jgi:hypothetical protein
MVVNYGLDRIYCSYNTRLITRNQATVAMQHDVTVVEKQGTGISTTSTALAAA